MVLGIIIGFALGLLIGVCIITYTANDRFLKSIGYHKPGHKK